MYLSCGELQPDIAILAEYACTSLPQSAASFPTVSGEVTEVDGGTIAITVTPIPVTMTTGRLPQDPGAMDLALPGTVYYTSWCECLSVAYIVVCMYVYRQ